jgi:hypothetical protein
MTMADPGSRYSTTETAELTVLTMGRTRRLRYLRRRFLPRVDRLLTIVEHHVGEGDRLDNLSARYLGDPLAWWRIADANLDLEPETLTDEAGRRIRVAVPQP